MQYAEFRDYLQQRGLPDDWWISVDGEVQENTVTLDSATGIKRSRPERQVQISNAQEQDHESVPWHPIDLPAQLQTPAMPAPAAAPGLPGFAQPGAPAYQQPFPQQQAIPHQQPPSGYHSQTMVNMPPQGTQQQMYPQQYGGGGGGQSPHMKMMLLGLMLIMGSWGVKQIFASFAAYGLGGSLTAVTVQASQAAEVASQTVDKELEIYEEEQKDKPDRSRISELRSEISKVRTEVAEDNAEEVIESRADSASGGSLAANMARWFLKSKIVLDIVKLAGIFILVMGAFRVLQDPYASPHNRWFAIVSACIILFSVLAAGLASLLA